MTSRTYYCCKCGLQYDCGLGLNCPKCGQDVSKQKISGIHIPHVEPESSESKTESKGAMKSAEEWERTIEAPFFISDIRAIQQNAFQAGREAALREAVQVVGRLSCHLSISATDTLMIEKEILSLITKTP